MSKSQLLSGFLVMMILSVTGCTVSEHQLGSEWEPLTKVVERDLPFVSDTASTTVGTVVYTADLTRWLEIYPPGSVTYQALLKHEQVHAKRQIAYGTSSWIAKYLTDKSFAWEEEKLGYEAQILHLRRNGIYRPAEYWATILSEKYNGMVTYQEALTWAQNVR
jgi:hypothetical protein